MKQGILFLSVVFGFCWISTRAALTNHLNMTNRVGDQLIYFARSWCAAKTFELDSYFDLHRLHSLGLFPSCPILTNSVKSTFKHTSRLKQFDARAVQPEVLYVVDCCPPGVSTLTLPNGRKDIGENLIDALWFSPKLRQEFSALFTDQKSQYDDGVEKGTGLLSVAVHVRKGSGGDPNLASQQYYSSPNYRHTVVASMRDLQSQKHKTEPEARGLFQPPSKHLYYSDLQWPQKFPPSQFYLDQVRFLRAYIEQETKLIVYIFSDQNTERIAMEFKERLADLNNMVIVPVFSKQQINSIIDDLFRMAFCDVLIRSSSNFARAAQLLGDHSIVIRPKAMRWNEEWLEVPEVVVYDCRPSNHLQTRR